MRSDNPQKLFGTDGIRGEAGKFPLDPATVRIVGRSLARRLADAAQGRAPRIVAGRDTRESGAWIERELILGAREAGAEVQSAGVITTPGVAYLARSLPADAGVVISASHNPYHDNGIKVFDPSGRKLGDATERGIEADIAASAPDQVGTSSWEGGSESANEELRVRYLAYLIHDVARDLSLRWLTMVVDCANGAAYQLGPELFRRLGASVIVLNDKPDGRNINLNCGSLHIDGLRNRVVAVQADLGVAFDGDADRALFVDSNGEFVDGDATMWVMANYLKQRGELVDDKVIATVMSNIGLEIALRSQRIDLVRTDVGDKYVLEELIRSHASLGGEQSGHIIFPRLSLAGDGLITTISLLRAVSDQKKSLADLVKGFERFPQVLVNVRVSEKRPFEELAAVQNASRTVLSELGNRGRLLLRYSGTEPLARIMIEGESQARIEVQANGIAEAIKFEIGAVVA